MLVAKEIANKLGVPEKIAQAIITEHLAVLKKEIENHPEVDIAGLGYFRKVELRLQPGCEMTVLNGKDEFTTLGRIKIQYTEFTAK